MKEGPEAQVRFDAHPDRYRHWKLDFPSEYEGAVARLTLDVQEDGGLVPGYALKLNSYDLAVDIELADALARIRFEHPRTRALLFASAKPRVFSAGANIYMLGSSSHPFKVNFCKFTNETRLYLEEMSAESGIPSLAALSGTASGGGYELALACDEVVLVDDGSSAVSLPEAPLLGVLPGTGGLTRLVDKRKVRRDLSDVFATLAEGVRGQRAAEWRLIDEAAKTSQFEATVARRLRGMCERSRRPREGEGIVLAPIEPVVEATGEGVTRRYRYVTVVVDTGRRTATLTVRGPSPGEPDSLTAMRSRGSDLWALRAFRELDDALLDLRFNHAEIGVLLIETEGDVGQVLAADAALSRFADDWFVRETVLQMKRVLKRLDLSAKSIFALVKSGSCFVGSLLELLLAADRVYMLDAGEGSPELAFSPQNGGALPMSNGLTRLAARFFGQPEVAERLARTSEPLATRAAVAAGLVTFAPDELDWDDEVRIAVEERASLSPDALTGAEANLRFVGPETMETKIFGRLSAWQNWIFVRPNAVGPRGALTMYGQPERPVFDWRRT